ncbi:MAG: bifunctional phosphoribosylaminoimidazolecarboxamide formyltransferase/IMP cyclohydrolase [Actinomycetota bacterium]|nr:bifunctional phosphoribosylaminoimidazolecarboxamide formyltransferase/IMP cyclohydrolase [Actinomycetota bacterium]
MRALISVYDKTGIIEFATRLSAMGWEIVSSGGTAAQLREAGVAVLGVDDVTGSPEMLDGRVKTLHPHIHGGILADRSKPEHLASLDEHGISAIDLVVCNLYPFRSDPSVELIDIGGPTMVRAAAKNHDGVGIVVDPDDYETVLDELNADGALSQATRRRLARAAFAHTAAYDAAIVQWLDDDDPLPPTIHLALERAQEVRYGENPHQEGARYREIASSPWWDAVVQHEGMALSYLNLFDADAAWRVAHDLGSTTGGPAVAIIKHANPCGAAVGDDLADAYQRAYECDSRSAFGGIVAVNRVPDLATVERIEQAAQADLIIAPGYEDGVIERLRAKRKNTRVLEGPAPSGGRLELRQITGGWLAQTAHHFAAGRDEWRVVTERQPTDVQWADAEFAWRVCGHVTSNAIVLAKDGTAWGIGAGQQNRVESGQIATSKADGRAAGVACASDAFYPFPDGVEAAAESGAAVVIQPGGAMRDDDVIARANELGLAMIFTGERHFRH